MSTAEESKQGPTRILIEDIEYLKHYAGILDLDVNLKVAQEDPSHLYNAKFTNYCKLIRLMRKTAANRQFQLDFQFLDSDMQPEI